MTMKITFLGTGGSMPTRERGLPSVALEYDGNVYLFDCGEGTQRQAVLYSVNLSRVHSIFISHIHGDHMLGLAGLARTLALIKRTKPLYVYVPQGSETIASTLLKLENPMMTYTTIISGITPGVIFKGKGFNVSAFKVDHTVPTFGFAFELEKRMRFIKDKCKKLGIKGLMFRQLLKKGSIRINGKTIKLNDVTYAVEGKKIVYVTDTRPAKTTVAAAKNADLLMHEATFADSLEELARERSHSTAGEAAGVAKKAKCKRLVLLHFSARYKNVNETLRDARKVFKNTEAAKDGAVITI